MQSFQEKRLLLLICSRVPIITTGKTGKWKNESCLKVRELGYVTRKSGKEPRKTTSEDNKYILHRYQKDISFSTQFC